MSLYRTHKQIDEKVHPIYASTINIPHLMAGLKPITNKKSKILSRFWVWYRDNRSCIYI